MRLCNFLNQNKILKLLLLPFFYVLLRHYQYRYGIQIDFHAKIDTGLYIGHFGTIVVSGGAVIGKNCNLSQGVTIGVSNRGDYKGYPTIGDNVFIGPGAKIFGKIKIGNNVAIGANSVVTKNIPDNSVVVGIPGEIISKNGSKGYVCKTDY